MKTTKPDPDDQNDSRSAWAHNALLNFKQLTGCDDEDALADLLCNLRHLCDRRADQYGSFEDALDRANRNYDAETYDYDAESA